MVLEDAYGNPEEPNQHFMFQPKYPAGDGFYTNYAKNKRKEIKATIKNVERFLERHPNTEVFMFSIRIHELKEAPNHGN